jgi:hypothetical protein
MSCVSGGTVRPEGIHAKMAVQILILLMKKISVQGTEANE